MARLLRYTALLILLLIILGAVAGWWVFFRPLPQLDGVLSLPELKNEVTVDRDAWGVPRIRAASLEDLVTAQGYIVAQDRLWQMDLLRRVAAGELSEIFGAATIAADRQNRTYGFRRVAEQTLETLSAEERLLLDAYARGVNRFIEDHAGKLPWEFTALRYQPRPWQPTDTLLVGAYMYETLTSTWQAELNRAGVTEKVGPELARDLFTVDSPLDRFIVGEEPAPRAPAPKRAGNPALDISRVLPALHDQVEAMFGSNNWVVSGEHTYSGKPMLANDTHLPLQVPSIYYTIHLTAPGWNVKGFTLPGAPLVVIGHNQSIAWGFTNNGADVQDLYAIQFSTTNPDEYRYNGQMLRAERRFEAIRVRGQEDVSHEVVVTRHGPIVERDGNRAYALRWTALDPRGLRVVYWLLGRAQNWNEFRDILRDSGGPAQNVVYADVDGNIGFAMGAMIPIRRQGDGTVPVPGDTDAYEWSGYIPFDELPHVLNPPEGIIATANARVVGPGYRWYLTDRWGSAHRTARIYELLESGKNFRPEDFLAIQTDIISLSHLAIAGHIARAAATRPPGDARAQRLASQLEKWEGRATADSVDTSFVEFTRRAFLRRILEPHLGANTRPYQWWRHITFTENVLRDRPARWLPRDFPDYDSLISACADEAAAQLQRESGSADPARWQWGQFQRLNMVHPIGRGGVLRWLFSVPAVEQAGTGHTVKQTGRGFGPAQRIVADLGDWDSTLMNHHAGQSGQPFSPHYKDQFPLWLEGRSLPSPFTDAAWERAARHRLVLSPAPR